MGEIDLAQLKQDDRNANRGTDRGRALVEQSLRELGAGRSVLIDKDGRIIAGNKTVEAAIRAGYTQGILVPSDGKRLVVVQREDLDLTEDPGARELSYMDNQTSAVGLAWDAEIVQMDLAEGVNLSGIFNDEELAKIAAVVQVEPYDFGDLDEELAELEGMEEIDIKLTVAAQYREAVIEWLANGEAKTAAGMGKGVLKRCGLL